MTPVQKLAEAGIKASVIRMPWGLYWHTDVHAKKFREGHIHKDFGFIFEWPNGLDPKGRPVKPHPVRIV